MKRFLLHVIHSLLLILSIQGCTAQPGKDLNYGDNPANGHYLPMKDKTRIYYEVYGSGKPLVLLHGGLYGNIAEYGALIPVLSKHFMVIAIATRGHEKSEIGRQPFTYNLLADDAYAIIKHVTHESATVIGFSVGAMTAITLTVEHPEVVNKLVFIGGQLSSRMNDSPEAIRQIKAMTGESFEQQNPGFVAARKRLMPDPSRWDDFIEKFKNVFLSAVLIKPAQLKKVTCPVLVMGGDKDDIGTENLVATYKLLPNASLAIIPNSGHVVFAARPDLVENIIVPFVLQ